MNKSNTTSAKVRRQRRTRAKTQGTSSTPRLSVFRSNRYIYAQLIDDEKGKSLLGVSEKHLGKATGPKAARAAELGKLLAQKAKEKKIGKVVFDKGSYAYHGRVRQVAEGAREGGLKF